MFSLREISAVRRRNQKEKERRVQNSKEHKTTCKTEKPGNSLK